jgi:hypothetical protein
MMEVPQAYKRYVEDASISRQRRDEEKDELA